MDIGFDIKRKCEDLLLQDTKQDIAKDLFLTTAKIWRAYALGSEPERCLTSIETLRDMNITLQRLQISSVIWVLQFESTESMMQFQQIHSSGHMQGMVQEDFVTPDFLDRHSLESAELKVNVSREEFDACRNALSEGMFAFSISKCPNKNL